MSEKLVKSKFIIVAVELPAEDVEILLERGVVVARLSEENEAGLLQLAGKQDWQAGSGLLGTLRDDEGDPGDFAMTVLERFAPNLFEAGPEFSESSKASAELKDLRLEITHVEVYGVSDYPELNLALKAAGFGRVDSEDWYCVAHRNELS